MQNMEITKVIKQNWSMSQTEGGVLKNKKGPILKDLVIPKII